MSHTNILLRFLSLSRYLSFSVTLNVILYFANRLRLSPQSLPLCQIAACVLLVFSASLFVSSWIPSRVFDLLCWLFIVKHTFNSSILYCICFPFLLSCFFTLLRVWLCLCAFFGAATANGALRTQIHTPTLTHTRVCPRIYRLEATDRCAIDGFQFVAKSLQC